MFISQSNYVFISQRLNRRQHRFNFVRFIDVAYVKGLEKQLDNI